MEDKLLLLLTGARIILAIVCLLKGNSSFFTLLLGLFIIKDCAKMEVKLYNRQFLLYQNFDLLKPKYVIKVFTD